MATLKSIKNKYLTASDGALLGVDTNTENLSLLSFKFATANSLTKFNLVDGFSDDYNDASGVNAAGSTAEIRNTVNNYYSGTIAGAPTGGTITTYTGYTIHSFTSTGNTNFVVPGPGNVDLLIVAGGGGGGSGNTSGSSSGNGAGGAGGAGGFRTFASTAVTTQTYVITVGAGGARQTVGNTNGNQGLDSSALGLSASGGGRGATWGDAGAAGGSGGGAAAGSNQGGDGNAGSYTPVEGYAGATCDGSFPYGGTGGGGASEEGNANEVNGRGGPGGDGVANSYRTGSAVTYAGGGGGGSGQYGPGGGGGGAGGGGSGGSWNGGSNDGTDGLGGGGGGGSYHDSNNWFNGGAGGDGIVVIRYVDGTFNTYQNMILASNTFTAQTAGNGPTTARIIIDEWAYKGAQILDTDLKAYASRDGGTTYTQTPLSAQGYLLGAGGINGNTELMLHCDGSNAGTTFTDSCAEGGNIAKVWTASGNAVTSTAQQKFGTASAYFDGTGDYINTPATTDWDFGSDNFTIDFWMRPGDVTSQQRFFGNLNSGGSSSQFEFIQGGDGIVRFSGSLPSGLAVVSPGATMVNDTWYHYALIRNGTDWILFKDGVAGSTASYSGTMAANTTTSIGRSGEYNAQLYTGFIDEVRITTGVAVWTSAFTPPAQEYQTSRRLVSGSVDISGQPAGTNMKYKIETLNQATAKQTRIYGTSMAWA